MANRRETFIATYLPYAQEASAITGIDAGLILAQAAHETAWGRSAPGNNFFGIKGGGQTFATHEYIGGRRVNMKAGFRRYDDPRQSFLDWAKLMQTPRYAKVLAARTPEEQAKALKASGYATDPSYVNKLLGVRNQITQVAGEVAPATGIGGIMDVAAINDGTGTVPDQPTASMGFAPDLGGVRSAPAQMAIADMLGGSQSPMPTPQAPPQWAQANAFPIDEALSGRSAQDVLMGGPRSDPRRIAPGTGPIAPDMGSMLSPADVLAAGPRMRPGGAPDASAVPMPQTSPFRPAMGGPNDRRPQPPMPPMRPGGAPDAASVPNPPPRAQGIPNPPSNPRRDPYGFPIDVSRPRINNPDGSFSTERTTTFDAAEVGLPSEIVTVPTIVNGRQVSEDEARALFASGQNPPVQRGFGSFPEADRAAEARTGSIAAARATNGERGFPQFWGQQPGPPPASPMVAGRPEFPGAMPSAQPPSVADASMASSPEARPSLREEGMFLAPAEVARQRALLRANGRPEIAEAALEADFYRKALTQFIGPREPPATSPLAPTPDPGAPARTDLTPALLSRVRERQGIGPFPARPEFPGALPPAPNPYDDWTRQFDVPGAATRATMFDAPPAPEPPPTTPPIGNVNYSDTPARRLPQTQAAVTEPGMGLGPYGMTPPPPSPPSPFFDNADPGPTFTPPGTPSAAISIPKSPFEGSTGEGFTYAPPMPAPPPVASPGMRDQFDVAFAPGRSGQIMDLQAAFNRQNAPPTMNAQDGINSVFGAPPVQAMPPNLAIPFAEVPRPNFDFAGPAPAAAANIASPMPTPGISRADFDARFAGGTVAPSTPKPGVTPGVVAGEMPTPAVPAPPPPAPAPMPPVTPPTPPQRPPTQQQRQGIARLLGGLLGGPIGALGGGLLGGGGGGGGFGFGQPATFAWSGGGSAPYGNGNTTSYQTGSSNALGGSNALSWQGSKGQTVTVVEDPWHPGQYMSTF